MLGRSRTKFTAIWQGRQIEVLVKEPLDDQRAFGRDLKLIADCARTFDQVTRDLNDLAQENGLVVHLDPAGSAQSVFGRGREVIRVRFAAR